MRFFQILLKFKIYIIFFSALPLAVSFLSPAFAQNIDYQLRMAGALEKNHQYDDAIKLYQNVYKNNKRNITAIIGIKKCLIGLQQYEQLLSFLKEVIHVLPANSNLHIDLAEAYFLNDKPEEALSIWQSQITQNINDPTTYRLVAMAMIRQRLLEEAIAVYTSAIQKIRGQENLHVEIANLYKAQLNYEKASEHLLEYYLKRPKQLAFLRRQLLSLTDKGQDITPIENALISFLVKHPEQRNIQELLAGLYMKDKQFDKAFEINKSLENKNTRGAYLHKYALEAYANHAFSYAIDGFEYLITTYPSSPLAMQAQFDLAKTFEAMAYTLDQKEKSAEAMQKATEIFKKIISSKSKYRNKSQSYYHLGNIYFKYYFDLDNAIEYYNSFINIYPRDNTRDRVLINLGDTYLTKNLIEEALKTYRRIKNKNSRNLAEFKIAEIYFYLSNFQKAERALSRLLSDLKLTDSLMNDILARQMLVKSASDDSISLSRFAQAELHKFQKKYAQAAEEYAELSQKGSKLRSLAVINASRLYIKLGKYEESKKVLEVVRKDISYEQNIDEITFLLALSEEKLNNLKSALDLYQELMITYPHSLFIQDAREKARLLNIKLIQEQT